jgi:hypothetical protein
MKKKIQKFLPIILLWLIVIPWIALADNLGLDKAAGIAGLKGGKINDWKDLFVVIINAVLMTIGFISICITIYGGFTWMTAAGDESKVATAKKIIAAGVMGLVVILISIAINNAIFGLMGVKLTTWG